MLSTNRIEKCGWVMKDFKKWGRAKVIVPPHSPTLKLVEPKTKRLMLELESPCEVMFSGLISEEIVVF